MSVVLITNMIWCERQINNSTDLQLAYCILCNGLWDFSENVLKHAESYYVIQVQYTLYAHTDDNFFLDDWVSILEEILHLNIDRSLLFF